tara:strand:- start:83011 stop:83133 length:123 start_codon:yes stop_codon:yes gene_type:complete
LSNDVNIKTDKHRPMLARCWRDAGTMLARIGALVDGLLIG